MITMPSGARMLSRIAVATRREGILPPRVAIALVATIATAECFGSPP